MDFHSTLTTVTEEQSPKTTPEAYKSLRSNLVEAAKHSRNLFMTHLAVQSYALIVLAGFTDKIFFQEGNQQKLPVIDASVALSWFLPALAVLSLSVFVYWQMYQRKMWLLAHEVTEMASRHRGDPDYVPPDGNFLYPWIGFFAADNDAVLRFGAFAFGLFQWGLMPLVQLVCWMRTLRLGGRPEHWIEGLPWGPCFGGFYCASLLITWKLRVVQRRHAERAGPTEHSGLRAVVRRFGLKRIAVFRRGLTVGWGGDLRSSLGTTLLLLAVLALLCAPGIISWRHPLQAAYLHASGRRFDGIALPRANLRGADLRRAYLNNAKLGNANLSDANLSGAILGDADLNGANLSGANLSSANLSGAILNGANLSDANLSGANLSGANLNGANLSSANLSSAILSDTNLSGANLSSAILSDTNLSDANLSGANFLFTIFGDADLNGANLSGANLSSAIFIIATNLRGANLSGANLSGANLSSAKRSSANLSDAKHSGAKHSGAKHSGANLSGANLGGADLSGADLSATNLSGANLIGADLRGADLCGADLSAADYGPVLLDGATYDDATKLPEGITPATVGLRHVNSPKHD